MKKLLISIALLLSSLQLIAQEKETKKIYPQDIDKDYELKLNAFSLIVFSSIDVSYEKLLNKDSSYGIAIFYNFADIESELYFPKKFSLTPYYRWFFSEKRYARGYFVEGFGMLNHYKERYYYYSGPTKTESETDFALGISVGGKFIIKSGFTAEIFLGVGRNLFHNSDNRILDTGIITRGGISLGYRF
ncbi:DUF3575 domain-containing protein [Polaribacter tangerinus]|uniref:DUF3575 domain-containing protein n=1 Tax=Polaribacter tangerinus TaxID=1920034 RepID=UPI000B4B1514|nr:DUF3575 domain-containing protein [Polaribacter tangerinus]